MDNTCSAVNMLFIVCAAFTPGYLSLSSFLRVIPSILYRYQFFLQVKRDILQGRLPVQFDLSVELAAYAAQCKYNFAFDVLSGK